MPYADVVDVESAAEMTAAAVEACADADALISAAAIADYTVEPSEGKIRSGEASLTLELTPTPKLLDAVRDEYPALPLVGFKAEPGGDDEALAAKARETLERVDLAFVVANDAGVMGAEDTRALVVHREGAGFDAYTGSKLGLGLRVADELATVIG